MKYTGISRREVQLIDEIGRRDMVIFTVKDVEKALRIGNGNAQRIIRNMQKKGLAVRIERGKYALKETFDQLDVLEITSQIWPNSYISLWSALHFHHMTRQVPKVVFLAVTRRKRDLRIQDRIVRIVHLPPKFFFGYRRYGKVVASDPEKTIIDCLRFPHYSGGFEQIFSVLDHDLNVEKLLDYCVLMESPSLASRLGYMLERREIEFDRNRIEHLLTSYTRLYAKGEAVNLDRRWKLYVNGGL